MIKPLQSKMKYYGYNFNLRCSVVFLGNSDIEEGCATSALDIKVILFYNS